jgi:hypothetical protein
MAVAVVAAEIAAAVAAVTAAATAGKRKQKIRKDQSFKGFGLFLFPFGKTGLAGSKL